MNLSLAVVAFCLLTSPIAEITNNQNMIALTFDDGPSQENTLTVLKTLEDNDVPATFFIVGERISDNEGIIKLMDDLGCEIGNHTFSHLKITSNNPKKVAEEISQTQQLIFDIIGKKPRLFRPPGGYYQGREELIEQCGLINVMWNVDPRDWETRNTDKTIKRCTTNIKAGDIILLHDIHQSSVLAVDTIIKSLKKQGFRLVTISELLANKEE